MEIKFTIEAVEWKFEEVIPFPVEKINDKEEDYDLPLFDAEGNEKESISLPNCRVLELEGIEDSFHVVFETGVIKNFDKIPVSDNRIEYKIQLAVDQALWQQGEDAGIFYSWKNLPEELKKLEVKNIDN